MDSRLVALCCVAASLLACYGVFGKPQAEGYGFGRASHNLTIGRVSYRDRLLFHTVVSRSGIKKKQVSADVDYPVKGYRAQEVISCIRAIDHWTNGTGGYPSLTRGGVGLRNATVHILSNFNLGFKFTVQIFGH